MSSTFDLTPIKQSINQSINKSTPSLDTIDILYFTEICSYITLDEKCWRLPVLSKAIKRSFEPSLCCAGYVSFTSIDEKKDQSPLTKSVLNTSRAGRMKYVQHASRIRSELVGFEQPPNRRKNILLSIRKSLLSSRLQQLIIKEGCFAPMTPSISSELFTQLGRASVKLRELYVDLSDSLGDRPTQYWGGLKQCLSLNRLFIDISHDIFEAGPYKGPSVRQDDMWLIHCLPSSLKEFIVISAMPAQPRHQMWCTAFGSNDFLPHLERFALRCPEKQHHADLPTSYFGPILNQFIMKETGKTRPITSWTCRTFEDLDQFDLLPLKEITLSGISAKAASVMLKCPSDFFPNLRRAAIYGIEDPFDPFPFISFASKRPVEHFMMTSELKTKLFSLSDEAVKALASIKSLKFLNLRAKSISLFKSPDLSDILPANSWPHVDHLELYLYHPTEQQLRCIIAAVPNCRSAVIAYESRTITQSLVAAMVAHYCPNIINIQIIPAGTPCDETMKNAQDSFTRYPVTDKSVQHLICLALPQFIAPAAVFHYFVRQFSHAPHLSFADLGTASVSTLFYCITRGLPHVRYLNQLCSAPGVIHKRISSLGLAKLNNTITFRISKGDWMDKHIFDKSFYGKERAAYYCESLDEAVTLDFLVDGLYPVFKEVVESGKTGRESFYQLMYGLLSASDKQQLADWDAGKYKLK